MALPLVYLNGQFTDTALSVPVLDAGFVFGATVTDRVRTFNRRLFRLDDHLARFRESCRLCRVPLPVGDADLRSGATDLALHNASLLPPGGTNKKPSRRSNSHSMFSLLTISSTLSIAAR